MRSRRTSARPRAKRKTRPTSWPSPKKRSRTPTARCATWPTSRPRPMPSCSDLAAEQRAPDGDHRRAESSSWPSCCASTTSAGNEDRIKLLLSGDNPNRINRDLQMMAYVSQAQAKLLDSLRANLAAVEANQAETPERQGRTGRNRPGAAATRRPQLEKEKAKRAELLAQPVEQADGPAQGSEQPGARRAAHERPGRQPDATDPRTGRSGRGRAQAPAGSWPPRAPRPRPKRRRARWPKRRSRPSANAWRAKRPRPASRRSRAGAEARTEPTRVGREAGAEA